MEFLLQLFADMVGDPEENQISHHEEIKEKEVSSQTAYVVDEKIEEEPVLFGLMQFH